MRILLVDDEKECTDSLVTALKPSDYDVIAENYPLHALELYKTEKYDLVITDVRMPKMTGIELLKAIRAYDNKARVIVITAYGDLETAIAAINNKAVAFFSKPINFEELIDMICILEKEINEEKIKIDDIKNIYFENIKLKRLYHDLLKIITKDNEKNPLTRI